MAILDRNQSILWLLASGIAWFHAAPLQAEEVNATYYKCSGYAGIVFSLPRVSGCTSFEEKKIFFKDGSTNVYHNGKFQYTVPTYNRGRSRGPCSDGRTKPDVSAPGNQITSASNIDNEQY